METQISASEIKLRSIMQHAYMGIVEINCAGQVVDINLRGKALLKPLFDAADFLGTDFFAIADLISPKIAQTIRAYDQPAGVIIANEVFQFSYVNNEQLIERDYKFTISKMFAECIVMSIDDDTEKIAEERAMQQAQLDRAVAQGKFEIASEVLHDIGNAVVGFGSYLTRINRMLEQNPQVNLPNVVNFMKGQETALVQAIGAPKAGALINMVDGISKIQQQNTEEIQRTIIEQLNIVNHIQEILNIQRQYVVGHESQDRKPVNLGTVIYDCRAMVQGTIENKGVKLFINIPPEPVIIKGDRTKLMQVILNVLKNSIEAIDSDAQVKDIKISLVKRDNHIELTIADTGKGFDAETGVSLFKRGYTTKSTGTGLGLYNCRSIIESHAGTIRLNSSGPGLGATTAITFAY